jgi:hypothetical protein
MLYCIIQIITHININKMKRILIYKLYGLVDLSGVSDVLSDFPKDGL